MRVVVTGGGTGGHLYPALAVADSLRDKYPDTQILYIGGDGIESEVVPKYGYDFCEVPARWFYRGEGVLFTIREFFRAAYATAKGIRASKKLISEFRPDAVIGTGGFVSVPVILAAHSRGVRCLIHEQNAFPGMANKIMARFADRVLLGFPGTEKRFPHPERCIYTGNPVRKEFFETDPAEAKKALGIPEGTLTVFTLGGSLGSHTINEAAYEYAKRISGRSDRFLIFGTGNRFYDEYRRRADEDGLSDNILMLGYIDDMPGKLAACDLMICRAGALSLAEVAACGKPAIIIPYPWSADDHQYHNARSVEERGAALLVKEDDTVPEHVASLAEMLISDGARLAKMRHCSISAAQAAVADMIAGEIRNVYESDKGL